MTPVFIGGCVRALVERKTSKRADEEKKTDQGILLASA